MQRRVCPKSKQSPSRVLTGRPQACGGLFDREDGDLPFEDVNARHLPELKEAVAPRGGLDLCGTQDMRTAQEKGTHQHLCGDKLNPSQQNAGR